MIVGRTNAHRFWLTFSVTLIPFVSFVLAGLIRFYSGIFRPAEEPDLRSYFGLCLLATVLWAGASEYLRLGHLSDLSVLRTIWQRGVTAWLTGVMLTTAATFFYRRTLFSRTFLAIASFFWLVLAFGTIWHIKRKLLSQTGNLRRNRIALIGVEPYLTQLKSRLKEQNSVPCEVVTSVNLGASTDDATQKNREWEQFKESWGQFALDDILAVWSPTTPGHFYPEIVTFSKKCSVPLRLLLHLDGAAITRDDFFYFLGYPVLGITGCPGDSFRYVVLKRAFDIVISILLLVLLSPFMLLITLLIKLTLPGRILHIQERVGVNGKRFKLYKFRTMRAEADKREAEHAWTVPSDPRVTPLGRYLRRFSIDELPQFINVLRGDMSVVGPRPERPFFVEKFLSEVSEYNNRHHIRAGITGWAQINGLRGDSSINKRVEFDLYYMRNWSMALDMKIICLTVLRMIRDPNAY
jgi:Undecaprenyl-phosphate glucose phosphotransferase